MKIGDKVIFQRDRIDEFINETTNVSSEVDQYRKLVLAGVEQIGVIKGLIKI